MKRRRDGKRMDGRTDVVHEARQRQRRRPHAAADGAVQLRTRRTLRPGLRDDDRRRQAVRTGADRRPHRASASMLATCSARSCEYWYSRLLFERALALMYLVAFIDAANQFVPLLGEHGLMPVGPFVTRGAVPRVAEPVLFRADRHGVSRLRPGSASRVACLLLTGYPLERGWAASAVAWARAVGALSLVRERRPDVLRLRLGNAAARSGIPRDLSGGSAHGADSLAHLDLPLGRCSG